MKKFLSMLLVCVLLCISAVGVFAEDVLSDADIEAGIMLIDEAAEAEEEALSVLSVLGIDKAEVKSITFSKGDRGYTTEEPSIIELFFEFAGAIDLVLLEESLELEEGGYHVMLETVSGDLPSIYVSPDGYADVLDMDTISEPHGGTYQLTEPLVVLELLKIFLPEEGEMVAVSEWAYEIIGRAYSEGFIPMDFAVVDYTLPINREDFCKLASVMLAKCGVSKDVTGKNPFTDTNSEVAIELFELGIIKGKSETEFAPADVLTREEAATILCRMAALLGDETKPAEDVLYADDTAISDWAKDSVYVMRALGVMQGTSETEFAPKMQYTAEQAVATMLRLYDTLQAE
ncbi:MAG: S-layer homology domain-containing protein [Ruminococcaceae bacterium]|nr:S-layer homology domain-containing protein [Oscillospiraceae bacterium]